MRNTAVTVSFNNGFTQIAEKHYALPKAGLAQDVYAPLTHIYNFISLCLSYWNLDPTPLFWMLCVTPAAKLKRILSCTAPKHRMKNVSKLKTNKKSFKKNTLLGIQQSSCDRLVTCVVLFWRKQLNVLPTHTTEDTPIRPSPMLLLSNFFCSPSLLIFVLCLSTSPQLLSLLLCHFQQTSI